VTNCALVTEVRKKTLKASSVSVFKEVTIWPRREGIVCVTIVNFRCVTCHEGGIKEVKIGER